jgi:ABC-type xylose transport system substrate-binding protein
MARPVGRPRKYSAKQIKEISQKLEEYIETAEIPIVAEFAYKNNIVREELYKYDEFSTLLKKLIAKKETVLEKGMLSGDLVTSAAIFSLKQVGWSDKQQTEITGKDGGPIRSEVDVEKVVKRLAHLLPEIKF